jgi:hypothetical protein
MFLKGAHREEMILDPSPGASSSELEDSSAPLLISEGLSMFAEGFGMVLRVGFVTYSR